MEPTHVERRAFLVIIGPLETRPSHMVGWLDGHLVPHVDILRTDPQAALVSRTEQVIF